LWLRRSLFGTIHFDPERKVIAMIKTLAAAASAAAAIATAAPAHASCATWCSGRTGSDWASCMASCAGSGY
jgi:hypothetical protein